jgi:fused signal recognition particle receptor
MKTLLKQASNEIRWAATPPTVILVTGVNGVGKTTSIAKLCKLFRDQGKKVILGAADTFRAGAVNQLTIWAERTGAEIVKHQEGADPAAVCFDAAEAALARKADVLIIDTAGRLQTKEHLMKELDKIRRTLEKKIPSAPHETLLVLDSTTGQNALSQAEHFSAVSSLTGIFLAKLDGTAKGGVVFAIKNKFNVPVKFVGLGEKVEDIAPFNPDEFVEGLFE